VRIGIDFDNTIVRYDEIFHRVALESDLIPLETAMTKSGVRQHLCSLGREEDWTRLQGLVYGLRMVEALPYTGLDKFMFWAKSMNHEMFIISHRTLIPALGPAYDLHAAANSWVVNNLQSGGVAFLKSENIFFETEKAAKIERIQKCRCDMFIDDLPEILLMDKFPSSTVRILFDPDKVHIATPPIIHTQSWHDVLSWSRSYDR
jgi:hypothetical protein